MVEDKRRAAKPNIGYAMKQAYRQIMAKQIGTAWCFEKRRCFPPSFRGAAERAVLQSKCLYNMPNGILSSVYNESVKKKKLKEYRLILEYQHQMKR
jgi:hypothetical protein